MEVLGEAFDGLEKAVVARFLSLTIMLRTRAARSIFFRGHDGQGLIKTKSSPCVTKFLKS